MLSRSVARPVPWSVARCQRQSFGLLFWSCSLLLSCWLGRGLEPCSSQPPFGTSSLGRTYDSNHGPQAPLRKPEDLPPMVVESRHPRPFTATGRDRGGLPGRGRTAEP